MTMLVLCPDTKRITRNEPIFKDLLSLSVKGKSVNNYKPFQASWQTFDVKRPQIGQYRMYILT